MLEDLALLAEVARAHVLDLVEDDAADLGADDVVVARPAGERLAHADLGEARAVEGRVVEVADAVIPGGFDRRERFSSGMSRNMLPSGAAPKPSLPGRISLSAMA